MVTYKTFAFKNLSKEAQQQAWRDYCYTAKGALAPYDKDEAEEQLVRYEFFGSGKICTGEVELDIGDE